MREIHYLALLVAALPIAIALAGGNSAIVGALLSLTVSQIYFMRRSKAEEAAVSTIDALRNLVRFQINNAAGERLSRRRVEPNFHHSAVDDVPTVISARSTRRDPRFVLLTIRDNGFNFPSRDGMTIIGIADADRIPLFYDPIGFGLFVVYLERRVSEIHLQLTDSANNTLRQKVYLDDETS
ncbi:hypothetical protein [Tahibacter caeni]|uniref:hypothetical protein n=1 Tax=Tahibacter caeni TaxID=1453545 RepID=UPI0021480CCF|nr:hypothetical protein [Tahibacter caeni]